MNSSTSENLWPSPVGAHTSSLTITNSQTALCALVASHILTAVSAGLFTCSTSVSSASSVDVQYVTALLNQGNYQAQVTGTNLIVSW